MGTILSQRGCGAEARIEDRIINFRPLYRSPKGMNGVLDLNETTKKSL